MVRKKSPSFKGGIMIRVSENSFVTAESVSRSTITFAFSHNKGLDLTTEPLRCGGLYWNRTSDPIDVNVLQKVISKASKT